MAAVDTGLGAAYADEAGTGGLPGLSGWFQSGLALARPASVGLRPVRGWVRLSGCLGAV
ncbi:hypothetical protein GCM10022251_67980 [Phytohabitans flavus]|uniref:Uncharacterized protein n=1 Tax=Phytohabitans flavus TaxID=1076124 RepID=A0A6F8XQL4_9ACTN|nr:hypothetical protein Pflav_025340 [Phytohabitans flavus]